MALTPSNMQPLGMACPHFDLPVPDLHDEMSLRVCDTQYANRPLLVMFICNHCPFVVHVAPAIARVCQDYGKQVGIVAINSNDPTQYPADAPELMAATAKAWGIDCPYAFDQSQAVACAFGAACTPDVFLFDALHKLYYRGQIDATRPTRHGPGQYESVDASQAQDLRQALDGLLAGQAPPQVQYPSMGCNIKWKQ